MHHVTSFTDRDVGRTLHLSPIYVSSIAIEATTLWIVLFYIQCFTFPQFSITVQLHFCLFTLLDAIIDTKLIPILQCLKCE